MTTHIMLDNESFDTRPTSCIIQIAAVAFDFKQDESGVDIDIRSWAHWDIYPQADRTCDPQTIAWWFSDANKESMAKYVAAPKCTLQQALGGLAQFVGEIQPRTLYSRGTDFDFPMLRHAYESMGAQTPWPYGRPRDLRTLTDLSDIIIDRDAVSHTALDDCMGQIKQLGEVATKLNLEKL